MSITAAAILAVVSFCLGFGLCFWILSKEITRLDDESARNARDRL